MSDKNQLKQAPEWSSMTAEDWVKRMQEIPPPPDPRDCDVREGPPDFDFDCLDEEIRGAIETVDLAEQGYAGLPAGDVLSFVRDHGLDTPDNVDIARRMMLRDCGVVEIGGSVRYFVIEPSTEYRRITGHELKIEAPTVKMFGRREFIHRFEACRFSVQRGDRKVAVALAEEWLRSPERRHYRSSMFSPGEGAPPRVFNTWRGWGITPKPGDWSMLREHVVRNLCCGQEDLAEYIFDWSADMLQNSRRKPGVALVVRGEKGVGKSKFAEWLAYVVGASLVLDKSDSLTRHFNAQLADKLLVVAEEAVWGGSKSAIGALNSLITAPSIVIERKGIDAAELPSRHRLIIIGNENWLVPASKDERRYLVLDVGKDRQQDAGYFSSMDLQMVRGGAAGMLHDLLHRTVTRDVMRAPRTSGLGHQIAASLPIADRLLVRLASDGVLLNGRNEVVAHAADETTTQADKAKLVRLIEDENGYPIAPREYGSALKECGIKEFRPHGGARQIIIPKIKDLRRAIEARLRTPFHILAGCEDEGVSDA